MKNAAAARRGLLALLIAHQVVLSAIWVEWDQGPPGWDQSIPLVKSLLLKKAFDADGVVGLMHAFPAVDRLQPPLLAALIFPVYALVGVTPDAAQVINYIAIIALGLALYGIGCRLVGPAAGLVAVYVAGTMPLLFGLSRQSYPEFPLAAATTLCIYLLVRSDDFRRRGSGIVLGIGIGVGLLLKMSFPVFVAAPLIVACTRRLRDPAGRDLSGRLVADLLAVAVPAGLVAAPWYLPNTATGLSYGVSAAYGHIASLENFGPVWSPLTLAGFLDLFVAWGASYFYGLLFLALFLLPASESESSARPIVAAWVIGSLVVFATALNKDIRYLTPMLPGIALLLGDRVVRVWRPWSVRWRSAFLLVPLISMYAVSFIPFEKWHGHPVIKVMARGMGAGFFVHPPRVDDWKTPDIVLALDQHATDLDVPGRDVRVVLTTNHGSFHKDLFNYTSLAIDRPYRFDSLPHYDPEVSLPVMLKALANADFILGTTGWQGPEYATQYNGRIHALLDRGALPFARVPLSIRLPAGSEVRLYRRVAYELGS